MDLLIYGVVLCTIGYMRMKQTSNVSDSQGIVSTGSPVIEVALPVGDNKGMYREYGAFTLILEELGLK